MLPVPCRAAGWCFLFLNAALNGILGSIMLCFSGADSLSEPWGSGVVFVVLVSQSSRTAENTFKTWKYCKNMGMWWQISEAPYQDPSSATRRGPSCALYSCSTQLCPSAPLVGNECPGQMLGEPQGFSQCCSCSGTRKGYLLEKEGGMWVIS